jgi:hypothetical protein
MRHRGRLGWVLAIGLSSAGGCGQELVIPQRGQAAAAGGEPGPSDGLTGASGAPSDAQSGKLPVLDKPVFTTFGGAGGEDSAEPNDPAPSSRGGTTSTAGSKSQGGASNATHESMAGEGGLGGGVAEPAPLPAVLLISEYVEGSHSYKALEILALEGGSLEDCELQTYANGNQEPSRLALHGTLAKGEVQVLCSVGDNGLATAQPARCGPSVNLTFNGDDALALSCAGVIQDIFGEMGVDPGQSWGVGATADHTLQRRCSVTAGRTDNQKPFDIDAEWITFGRDTFSDLGQRNCVDPEPAAP